jgi:hypothetical protein
LRKTAPAVLPVSSRKDARRTAGPRGPRATEASERERGPRTAGSRERGAADGGSAGARLRQQAVNDRLAAAEALRAFAPVPSATTVSV